MIGVLVTGARGMLGSDVVRCLARGGYEVGGGGRDVLDVGDRRACREAIEALEPDVVIDCALPTGVDREPRRLAGGARNVAEAAARVEAFSIYVSCASVFDGLLGRPYTESDAPSPSTPIGEAKLAAEEAVNAANPRHAIVRTSWLFGTGGGNLVEAALAAGAVADRVPVDATISSSPTYTRHLADALLLLVRRPAYGIFHLAGRGVCTELQLARSVLRLSRSGAQAVALEDDPSHPSGETVDLVLGTRRTELPPLPDWRLGVRAYLDERKIAVPGAGLELVTPPAEEPDAPDDTPAPTG